MNEPEEAPETVELSEEAMKQFNALMEHCKEFIREQSGSGATAMQFLSKIGGFPVLLEWVSMFSENDILITVLDKVLKSDIGVSLLLDPKILPYLVAGLRHNTESVRLATLKELGYLLQDINGIKLLLHSTIYPLLISLVLDESVTCAEEAVSFISVLCSSEAGMRQFFSKDSISILKSDSDSATLRSHELALKIAGFSPLATQLYHDSGLSQQLWTQFESKSDDLLYQLNVVELLGLLTESKESFAHLVSQNAPERLLKAIEKGAQDPSVSFLIVAVMKLFEKMASKANDAANFSWFQKDSFIRFLSAQLSSEDPSTKSATISTIGGLCASVPGLIYMTQGKIDETKFDINEGVFANSLPVKMTSLVTNHTDLIRLASLHGLHDIFAARFAQPPPVFLILQQKLFNTISQNDLATLFRFLKEPFEDTRVAVYKLYHSLLNPSYEWGIRALVEQPGMLEYLLNRKTETTKLGSEWKYDIIKAITSHPAFTKGLTNQELQNRLTEYVRQGVFYSKSEAVALVKSEHQ